MKYKMSADHDDYLYKVNVEEKLSAICKYCKHYRQDWIKMDYKHTHCVNPDRDEKAGTVDPRDTCDYFEREVSNG